MKVIWRATPTVTRYIRLYGHLRGPVTITLVTECLAVDVLTAQFSRSLDCMRANALTICAYEMYNELLN